MNLHSKAKKDTVEGPSVPSVTLNESGNVGKAKGNKKGAKKLVVIFASTGA
jgi:hypothetical protein